MLFIKQRNSYVVFLVICYSWSLIGVRVIRLLAEKLFLLVLLLKGVHRYMWMTFAPQEENCLESGLKNDRQDVFYGGCFQSQYLGTWESDVGGPQVLGYHGLCIETLSHKPRKNI